jgi:hypothetical protein
MVDAPRRIFVGYLPSGADTFVAEGEVDPVARLLADASARLDREREAEARAQAAKAADIERVKNTRRARAARRFRSALQMFARMRI